MFTEISRTGEVAWIQVVQWCLNFRAKIHAHYAPVRHKADMGGELRVAGKTPTQVDEEMLKRLFEKIAERRRYQARPGLWCQLMSGEVADSQGSSGTGSRAAQSPQRRSGRPARQK